MRRVPFRVRLRVPVFDVLERSGWLIEGDAGWGECSPLPSWDDGDQRNAAQAAAEAATLPFPDARVDQVTVNAMVPRIPPDDAARLAVESGCRTIKVKVGDRSGADRVAAVRRACGPSARIRVDANAAWDVDTARRELTLLAAYDIELAEDPVATLEDMAMLRRRSPCPVAAETSIRSVIDAERLRVLEAADAIVLKPQRIGGVRIALAAAEVAGVPAIASSALETSIGLAAVVALAAALGPGPFAHGCGTALLLEDDVTEQRLIPEAGMLLPIRPQPAASLLANA